MVPQLSGFNANTADDDAVRAATRWLLDVRVPQAAEVCIYISSMLGACCWLRFNLTIDAQALDARIADCASPTSGFAASLLHSFGVNCRYMGLVRDHCKCEASRYLLLSEMLARTFRRCGMRL